MQLFIKRWQLTFKSIKNSYLAQCSGLIPRTVKSSTSAVHCLSTIAPNLQIRPDTEITEMEQPVQNFSWIPKCCALVSESSFCNLKKGALSTTYLQGGCREDLFVLIPPFLWSWKRSSQYNISAGRLQAGSIYSNTSNLVILKTKLSVQHIWGKDHLYTQLGKPVSQCTLDSQLSVQLQYFFCSKSFPQICCTESSVFRITRMEVLL